MEPAMPQEQRKKTNINKSAFEKGDEECWEAAPREGKIIRQHHNIDFHQRLMD